MNRDTVLASSIARYPHLLALDLLVKKRLDNLRLDALLVYLIDIVSADALPYFAEQFDVLGFKGMRLATTEQQQRDLIKKAIELHRFKGTVWAVKQAMIAIGFPDAVLTEHVSSGENGWATFKINIEVGDELVSADAIGDLVKMINEYKNERSRLLGVEFSVVFDDEVTITDAGYEAPALQDEDTVFAGGNFLHDGVYDYDGTMNYSNDTDYLEITITEI